MGLLRGPNEMSAPRKSAWAITKASSLASWLLPLPSSSSPPRGTGDSSSVKVNPVLPLLKTLPWLSPTQSNGWHPLTACVTSHSLTPVNSQDSPPPPQAPSAPATPGTSLFLKHCKRAPASGPLHLLLPLPGRLLSRYPLGSLLPLLQFLGQRSPP